MLLSTLFLVITASFSAAHPPSNDRAIRIAARAPLTAYPVYVLYLLGLTAITELGNEYTATRTSNDMGAGTYIANGGQVTIKIGDKIGEGSYGKVYLINCDGNIYCEQLGPVVIKYHTKDLEIELERRNLARINQLKAVLDDPISGDRFTIMELLGGTNLSRLPARIELLQDIPGNREAINAQVGRVIAVTTAAAQSYIANHLIFHQDISEANVLLLSDSAGQVTGANLIDWGSAAFVEPEHMTDAMDSMAGYVRKVFSIHLK